MLLSPSLIGKIAEARHQDVRRAVLAARGKRSTR